MLKSNRSLRWVLASACLVVGVVFGVSAIAIEIAVEYFGAPEAPRTIAAYWTFTVYGLAIFGFGCKEAISLYKQDNPLF